MAAERGRAVSEGQEELPASGAAAHSRPRSHIPFQPLTRTSQWQATLDHTRSHGRAHHFIIPQHAQQQRYSCRLAHNLSAMTKVESRAQGSAGKLPKPSAPLFPKTPQQTNVNQKLTTCNKLCFAIGAAPKEVAASASAFFLQIYLLDVARINAFEASLVLFIGRVWGAVTDPIIGFLITKSKWTKIGRLMPWLLGCTPFLVVSYFYLWFVPPFDKGRFVWYLVFYCLYQTLVNCFHVSYSALTMFISTDLKERDSATAYRMTVEVIGTLVGATIQGQIVASAHTLKHCSTPNMSASHLGNSSGAESVKSLVHSQEYLSHAQKEVYMIAAGVIGGVFLLCTLVMFLGVKEREDPYGLSSEKQIPFVQGFVMVMRHGPYLILTAAFLLITVAVQLIQSNFVLFCTYAADLREHFQNIVVVILISAVLSIPFWQWFLQRFGKKTAAFCGIVWIVPSTLMLVYIPDLVVAYIVAVTSGFSIAASLLMPWSMLPDVVDDFRVTKPYSKGHEAIFYSFYVFFTKLAVGITLGLSTLFLEVAGYKTGKCKQLPPVVSTLKILMGVVPICFFVIGLIILVFYPINEDVRRRNKISLEELRKQSFDSTTMEDLSYQ
ncbi:major facilitator superfamily domain-containing protein 2B isoform X1 [Fundulus heteroclitus]|uniref:major facilitator superfamily domain-containing protein 2B isoform X1 n=1 Tax=Fundulus heteroclitus TaxID=8078 RepID=UPI00165A1558|nr:major facilitator superfamily domain-containing protein 2B isoform X1 [Fundulus heteroclitus]